MSGNTRQEDSFSENSVADNRKIVSCNNCSSSCPIVHACTSESLDKKVDSHKQFRVNSQIESGNKTGVVLVGRKSTSQQREEFDFVISRSSNNLGCIQRRLGCRVSWSGNRGSLVSTGKGLPYKHIGIEGRIPSHFDLSTNVSLYTINTHSNGQCSQMGGTKSQTLCHFSKLIWDFLLSKGITITVEYLPGILNIRADFQSRTVQDSSEWKLHPEVFQQVCQKFETPEIDLFASRVSHQVRKYFA